MANRSHPSMANPSQSTPAPGRQAMARTRPPYSASSWRQVSPRRATALARCRLSISRQASRRCSRSRTPDATLPRREQVTTVADSARLADPGLEALLTLLYFQGVAADAGQIRHRLGTDKIGAPEMLRCARDLGLKARAYRTNWSRLARTPSRHRAGLRWRVPGDCQGRRRQGSGPV